MVSLIVDKVTNMASSELVCCQWVFSKAINVFYFFVYLPGITKIGFNEFFYVFHWLKGK